MNRKKIVSLVMCAFFTALTCVLSQLAVPIGPVPVNLATLSVLCSGLMLGAKKGALSQAVYVLLGAAGIPVFAMFTGGMGIVFGPTGGFIAGYIAAAWVSGFIAQKKRGSLANLVAAASAGAAACLLLGSLYYAFSCNRPLSETLLVCVVPFLPGEALKIAVASVIAHRTRNISQRL